MRWILSLLLASTLFAKEAPMDIRKADARGSASQDWLNTKFTFSIHQDVNLYAALLDGKEEVSHSLAEERVAWIQVTRGSPSLNGQTLNTGDGAAIETAGGLKFINGKKAEFLLFDMAK